jgi:carbonic anhydrase
MGPSVVVGPGMTVTDELVANHETYAAHFDKGDLPLPPAKEVAVLACMGDRGDRAHPPHRLRHADVRRRRLRRSIQEETGIKPEWAAEAFGDLDEDVRQSTARIKASPFIPRKDAIRGFVYEVETGRLREVV